MNHSNSMPIFSILVTLVIVNLLLCLFVSLFSCSSSTSILFLATVLTQPTKTHVIFFPHSIQKGHLWVVRTEIDLYLLKPHRLKVSIIKIVSLPGFVGPIVAITNKYYYIMLFKMLTMSLCLLSRLKHVPFLCFTKL